MAIGQRLVTRGFSTVGPSQIITRGFTKGSIIERIIAPIVEFIRRIPKGRGAGYGADVDKFEEFTINVALIAVNSKELVNPLSGKLRIVFDESKSLFVRASNYVTRRVISLYESIVINAKRIIK
jgi:hypothetical protein